MIIVCVAVLTFVAYFMVRKANLHSEYATHLLCMALEQFQEEQSKVADLTRELEQCKIELVDANAALEELDYRPDC